MFFECVFTKKPIWFMQVTFVANTKGKILCELKRIFVYSNMYTAKIGYFIM